MKKGQKGFTLIELLIAVAVTAALGLGAAAIIFQIFPGMERGARISAACQVQDAGYWLNRDGEVAESILVDGLDPLNLVVMTWTERNYQTGNSVYHSATYYLDNMVDNVGDLKRVHWSNEGTNEVGVVARYIYYNPGDPGGTSSATYVNPVLTVRLASHLGEVVETREYCVTRRPNF